MISAKDVQKLRQATGAGMMDAKKALQEVDGDFEKASRLLLEKGIADARKRGERAQGQGSVGVYIHKQADRPVLGVLVELAAETDFVAKSEEFQRAANDLAMHVAAANPRWRTREEVPPDAIEAEKELITAQARNEGKSDDIISKMVEGKLKSFYQDYVLYEQTFVNPDRFEGTVGEMVEQLSSAMGENIGVTQFARLAVGGRPS
ncbi:MAG: elongation factor Ts [Acidimicrobiia bacterium]|nr:elongation factor Ts [Acidimicrobiia bacterium]